MSHLSRHLLAELREPRSLEVSVDFIDVVHELALQVVPHCGLVLCKSESAGVYFGERERKFVPCSLPDRFIA